MIDRTAPIVVFVWLLSLAMQTYADDWVYTIRPGDELWNIASKYCGSPSFADRIIEFNEIDDERGLRPGERIRIPVEWLVRQPVAAEITNVRGKASLFVPLPKPAEVGQQVLMGNRLTTDDGSVVVTFGDGSTLNVAPDSDVLFNVLTAYGDTGMVDTHLRFYRGRGKSKINRRDDASRFRISSPVGTAAVRGTEFRVAVSGDTSITETLEGTVGFIQTAETSVPQGFGAAASTAGVATEPLLPAPTWISAAGTYSNDASIQWRALPGAVSYRVTLYEPADLEAPLQQTLVQTPEFAFTGLSPGAYSIAVRGVSERRIEGYNASLAVDLATPSPVVDATATFLQDNLALSWAPTDAGGPYRVQIATDERFGSIKTDVVTAEPTIRPQLAPGNYFWRVKDTSSTFGDGTPVFIRPNAPQDLSSTSTKRDLSLIWSPSTDADGYRVRIANDAGFKNIVVQQTTTENMFRATMPTYDRYFIEVVTIASGVESPSITTDESVLRNHWWLLSLLVIPLLL